MSFSLFHNGQRKMQKVSSSLLLLLKKQLLDSCPLKSYTTMSSSYYAWISNQRNTEKSCTSHSSFDKFKSVYVYWNNGEYGEQIFDLLGCILFYLKQSLYLLISKKWTPAEVHPDILGLALTACIADSEACVCVCVWYISSIWLSLG